MKFEMPLAELIVDFYDQLKSRTQGYASLDYVFKDMRASDLVKLDVLVNGQPVDALSLISHRDDAYSRGRELVENLRGLIPRQMFDVPVQASIGSRIIARETIRAMRKNVLSKCYGGDVTRKAQAAREAKRGQSEDEARRQRRDSPRGIPRRAQPRRRQGGNQGMTASASRIIIAGLGPGNPELRTIGTQRALDAADQIILRTRVHPGLGDLVGDTRVTDCDDLYDSAGDFDVLYRAIADRVLSAARSGGTVVFAVPGHPRVGEKSVPLIEDGARDHGIPVDVLDAVSFLDATVGASKSIPSH